MNLKASLSTSTSPSFSGAEEEDIKQKKMHQGMIDLAIKVSDSNYDRNKAMHSCSKQLLLQREIEQVNELLEDKKIQVKERTQYCQSAKQVLNSRQKELRERMEKFSGIIEEGRIVRYKALQRVAEEEKDMKIKQTEVDKLTEELSSLREKNKLILKEVDKFLPYQKYLQSVYESSFTGYFDINNGESQEKAVVKRYQGLSTNRKYLQSEVAKLTNELSKARKELDQKKQEHQQKITMAYSYLAKLLKKKDKLINSNVSKEERIYKMLSNHRKKTQDLYDILSAIDNLVATYKVDVHHKHSDDSDILTVGHIEFKLKQIQDLIMHKEIIARHARMLTRNEMGDIFTNIATSQLPEAKSDSSTIV